jgi:hypothetical protein
MTKLPRPMRIPRGYTEAQFIASLDEIAKEIGCTTEDVIDQITLATVPLRDLDPSDHAEAIEAKKAALEAGFISEDEY